MRKLKKWCGMLQNSSVDGRANNFHRSRFRGYIAAYSQKQAAELIGSNVHEIKSHWSNRWGCAGEENIPEPTAPCLWVFDEKEEVWIDVTPKQPAP